MDLLDIAIGITVKDNASAEIKKISENVNKIIDAFGSVSEKSGEDLESLKKQVKETSEKIKKLSEEVAKATEKTEKVPEAGKKIGEKVSEGAKKGEAALGKLGKSGTQTAGLLESGFQKVASAVAAAFTVKKVLEFGVAAVNTAADAETSFAKVRTLLDGSTDVTAYYESVRKGAQEAGVPLAEYTEALYQSLSASVDQGNAVKFTTDAAKLARGGFTDLTKAVDVLTTIQNAYGMSTKQTSRIADKLVTTQNLGKVTVDELGQVMARSIPTARAYNVNLDTLLATYAVMTKNGNQAADSTTLLNATFNELGKYGTKAATILKEKTGKSFAQLMASGTSLTDVLGVLETEATKSGLAINDLFGSQEAAKGANIILTNAQDITTAISEMGDSIGASAEANATMLNTYNEQLKLLKTNWGLLMEEIGKHALPVLNKGIGQLNDVLTGNAYQKRIYGEFNGVAESFEEATIQAGKYKRIMDDLNEKYSGDNAGMIWSQEDLKAYNNAKMNLEGYQGLAQEFVLASAEMGESGSTAANMLQTATEDYVTSAQALLDQYQATYESTLANLDKFFSPFEKVSINVKTSLKDMMDGMQSQIDYFQDYNENIQTLTKIGLGGFSDMLISMGPTGAAFAQKMVDSLTDADGAVKDGSADMIQQLLTMQEQLTQSKDTLSQSVSNGVNGTTEAIKQLTEDYVTNVSQWDKSTEAMENAQKTVASFAAGLTSSKSSILAAAGDIGAQITQAIQANVGDIDVNIVGHMTVTGGRSWASRAIGMDYVPYNGLPAILHRGEAILNHHEAEDWRRGRSRGNSQGITINQTIQSVPQTPIQLAAATRAMFEQARWTL